MQSAKRNNHTKQSDQMLLKPELEFGFVFYLQCFIVNIVSQEMSLLIPCLMYKQLNAFGNLSFL